MPTFIDMSALTLKSSASGQEEIQVSESNKINTSQIAALTFAQNPNMGDLPINSRLKYVDNKTTLLGMLKMLTAAANVGRLRIVSGNPATGASGKPELAFIVNIVQGANAETQGTNGLQIFHLTNDFLRVIPSSSIGMAWPTLQTLTDEDVIKKLNSTASGDWGGLGVKMNWNQSSIATVEIIDFAVPDINVTKDGEGFFIYAYNPSHHPYNNDDSTSFVGIAVASPNFISGDQRLLYYMVVDTQNARFYTGYANMNDDSVIWSDGTQTRLGGAIKVTAFTKDALRRLLYDYKPGDFIPFYTRNVTASASNQFPESGVFNGFISIGGDRGNYFQIFAFKTGAGGKAYSGSCIESTATWTELGGGGAGVEQLFSGDIALANAAPETFSLGGSVSEGDRLMIVYNFISSDHTMIGSKQGRSIIWVSTSGTEDLTIEALNYNTQGGVTGLVSFNLMLSASESVLTMEATGDVDTVIEAFHVVGIYKLSKAL